MFILLIFAAVMYFAYFYVSRETWDVIDTPTVTPSGAIVGLCEVVGKAASAITPTGEVVPLLVGPISGQHCVWFHIQVEWYDDDGKHGGWKIYREKCSDGGFRIADKYGSIGVLPDQADRDFNRSIKQSSNSVAIMNAYNYFVKFQTGNDAAQYALWSTSPDGYYMWHPIINQWIPSKYVSPDRKYYFDWVKLTWNEIAPKNRGFLSLLMDFSNDTWSKADLRVTETSVVADEEIFAHGNVAITADGTDIVLGRSRSRRGACYFSSRGESKVLRKLKIRKWVTLFIAIAISVLSVSLFGDNSAEFQLNLVGTEISFSIIFIRLGVLGIIFSLGSFCLKFFRTYNRFVRLREQVRLSRSAIDITTKRRSSLIPQLCDVIAGAMEHEKVVLEAVAQLRAQRPDQASKEILALSENYPNIKTNRNFLNLSNELGRTEEKIAMARSFLNDSVLAMDNLRATLVGMVISPLFAKEER